MDFLSNFIKRPLSLVTNDSRGTTDMASHDAAKRDAVFIEHDANANADELALNAAGSPDQQSSTSTPMQTARSSMSPPAKALRSSEGESPKSPPIFVNSLIGSAIHTPLSSPHQLHGKERLLVDVDGGGACDATSTYDDLILRSSTCIDSSTSSASAGVPLLMQRSASSTNTSLNTTSSTIEELLIQINDSLDQATLNDVEDDCGVAVGDDVGKNSRAELGSEPSPHKSFGIKMSPGAVAPASPHQQAIAASPTVTPTTPKMVLIEPENGKLPLNNNNNNINMSGSSSGVNKSSNKFIGLTEFDESKIPDLPGSLNSDLDEQLKLTFEEGLIPTLTANVNTTTTPVSLRKDKVNALIEKENDTAFSSDNETFAECQPFPDAVNYTADMQALERTMELSDADAYRSAFNAYNGNLTCDAVDPLNGTLGNVASPSGEEVEVAGAQCGDGPMNMTFEEEPMDVDMSMVMMVQQVDTCLPPLEEKTQIDTVPVPEGGDSSISTQEEARPIVEISQAAAAEGTPLDEPLERPISIELASHELSLNKSVELTTEQHHNECAVIQDNSVDSATDVLPVIDEFHVERDAFIQDQDSISQISAPEDITSTASGPIEQMPPMANEVMTSSSSSSFDPKLSITLDMTSSFTSARSSAPSSPSFPIKPSKDEAKHFPRSPRAERAKEMPFLEKSDYAEHLNATRKKSMDCMRPSSGAHLQPESSNTTALCVQPSSESSESPKLRAQLDATFEGDEAAEISDEDPEKRRTYNVDCEKDKRGTFGVPDSGKRHTFNVIADDKPDSSSSLDTDTDKRRTFDAAVEPQPNDENVSVEAMDCDDDFVTESQEPPARSTSPPIPTLQKRSVQEPLEEYPPTSPPPTRSASPPIPTLQKRKQEEMENDTVFMPPPPVALLKRPSIHRRSVEKAASAEESSLSAKEQTKSNEMDEKEEVFVEQFGASTPIDDMFALPTASSTKGASNFTEIAKSMLPDGGGELTDADFQSGSNLILNPSDFDYLLTKGNSDNSQVNRSSLLMRFDPLLGLPVPANHQQQQQQQQQLQLTNNNNNDNQHFGLPSQPSCLSPTIEEDEHNESSSNRSLYGVESPVAKRETFTGARAKITETHLKDTKDLNTTSKNKNNATMSVDVINDMNIENDCNKASFENSNNSQLDEKQTNYNMDELEKKIKNEVLKTEDIEKKLKEAEQREEALIKRITEKDKTISKMNGVIESYEKTIAELVREKEQLIQNYEKQLAEVKADRDSNYHHLTSLETTFSDLHVKYEKSKEMTSQLKNSEEALLAEKRQNLENLRLQEQRYEKMKNHAMQQLEIANKKLESLTKEHSIESTKLKALLKKEEVSRASINEQLLQKSRENAELVKICDELINGPDRINEILMAMEKTAETQPNWCTH